MAGEFNQLDLDSLQPMSNQYFDNGMSLGADEFLGGHSADQFTTDGFDQSASGTPRSVHQCPTCNKIFVSFKGLQQHAIIHTDQKPFMCEICSKSFRFKSNLFEHRSVHNPYTPHTCPYCGKTCRLKGNLKKHLKTHVQSKEELDDAWKPFASNRRPPAEVPHDAIIVRGSGDVLYSPVARPRKKKLGLGADYRVWTDKIKRSELCPTQTFEEKFQQFCDNIKHIDNEVMSVENLIESARTLAFESFDCPMCRTSFTSRGACLEHVDSEHTLARVEKPHFCEICLRTFNDSKNLETHEEMHKTVQVMVERGLVELFDPLIMVPELTPDSSAPTGNNNAAWPPAHHLMGTE